MRSCYRPVLVFSPSGSDPRFKQQEATLDGAADDMMDRFMLLVPVLDSPRGYQAPLDAPAATLPARELRRLRLRFHVAANEFRVVLLDEDGADSLSINKPIPMDRMNSLIDSMPRRKLEMQRPNSN